MEEHNGKIIESAVEARGGFLGRPVLVVLVVSSLLVIAMAGFTHFMLGDNRWSVNLRDRLRECAPGAAPSSKA
jgi:Tfp pilus assembly protein PilX